MQIPCMLDKVIDKIGCGAIIKSTDTDEKAIVVDFDDNGGPLVCMYNGDKNKNKEPRFTAKYYKISHLADFNKWIVLHLGQDEYMLVN